jgi:hypothetical protein
MTRNNGETRGRARPDDWKNSTVIDAEELLELQIEAAKQRMCEAPDRADKMRHWREMCRLIDQRTPHRRRFMERLRGIGAWSR